MKSFFEKHIRQIGMVLVLTGAILLIMFGLTGMQTANWLLAIPLIMMVFGVIVLVKSLSSR